MTVPTPRSAPTAPEPSSPAGRTTRPADTGVAGATHARATDAAADVPHRDLPTLEPWLKLMLLAVVPLVIGMLLPRQLLLPLTALSVLVLVVSLVMFARRRDGRREVSVD